MPETIVIEPEEPAGEIDAATSAASAQTAAEHAASAIALSGVAAAQVSDNAAGEISAYQERLASCEARLQTVTQSQDEFAQQMAAHRNATELQMGEVTSLLSSIQAKLQPPPEPTPPNQEDSPDEAPSEQQA